MGRMLSLLAVLAGGFMMWATDNATVNLNSLGVVLMALGVLGFLLFLWLGDGLR